MSSEGPGEPYACELQRHEDPTARGFHLRGPYGIRTRAAAVRGRCPRPLDEWAERRASVATSASTESGQIPESTPVQCPDPLRGRLMVGRLTLDQVVKVRILAPQPSKDCCLDAVSRSFLRTSEAPEDDCVRLCQDSSPGRNASRLGHKCERLVIGDLLLTRPCQREGARCTR